MECDEVRVQERIGFKGENLKDSMLEGASRMSDESGLKSHLSGDHNLVGSNADLSRLNSASENFHRAPSSNTEPLKAVSESFEPLDHVLRPSSNLSPPYFGFSIPLNLEQRYKSEKRYWENRRHVSDSGAPMLKSLSFFNTNKFAPAIDRSNSIRRRSSHAEGISFEPKPKSTTPEILEDPITSAYYLHPLEPYKTPEEQPPSHAAARDPSKEQTNPFSFNPPVNPNTILKTPDRPIAAPPMGPPAPVKRRPHPPSQDPRFPGPFARWAHSPKDTDTKMSDDDDDYPDVMLSDPAFYRIIRPLLYPDPKTVATATAPSGPKYERDMEDIIEGDMNNRYQARVSNEDEEKQRESGNGNGDGEAMDMLF
ncbi:MAG: hypothetical protein Q9160_008564 [Pyrenula sp. 1 TL-2023]